MKRTNNLKLDNLNVIEIKSNQLSQIEGGGWIADAVEYLLCGCMCKQKTPRHRGASGSY